MASNERQRMLLRRLNAHLEGLSRAIEAVMQEGLSVRLEPVDLRLEKPSAATFHDSLQALFDAGVCRCSAGMATPLPRPRHISPMVRRPALCGIK